MKLFQSLAILAMWPGLSAAQAPPRFVATVQSVEAGRGVIAVQPDQGEPRIANVLPQTLFQRVAPGEKDLKQASTIQLTDVRAGDRVLIALEPGTDNLRRLVVMPAADIAKRNEADRQDWQKRGVTGVVTARTGNEITLKSRSITGESQTIVIVTDKTSYRQYAPDSVKFADAKLSALGEVHPGDQLRARGQKSEDGLKVMADEVVFGTFLTLAGKISTVDTRTHQIAALELNTNKPLLIKLSADSQIKRMPAFPGMDGGAGGVPPGGPGGMMPGGPGGAGGMRPPDLAQMLERMPQVSIDDLKPGDTIVVSSTRGAQAGAVTAIMLLANADMLIRMASRPRGASAGQPGAPGAASGPGTSGGGMGGGSMEGMQLPGIMP